MENHTEMLTQLQRYYALWRESNAVYEEWAKAHNLSLNSLMILYFFHETAESCTQNMISRKWFIPKQTVNTILKDFEKQGYIELLPGKTDKRNRQICLTAKGKSFVDTMISQLRSRELCVMKRLGNDRMTSMNDNLELFIHLFRKGEAVENES